MTPVLLFEMQIILFVNMNQPQVTLQLLQVWLLNNPSASTAKSIRDPFLSPGFPFLPSLISVHHHRRKAKANGVQIMRAGKVFQQWISR